MKSADRRESERAYCQSTICTTSVRDNIGMQSIKSKGMNHSKSRLPPEARNKETLPRKCAFGEGAVLHNLHPCILQMRPNKLIFYSGLDEFKEPKFKGYGLENSKKESNIVKESENSKENSDKSLVKELESQKNQLEEVILGKQRISWDRQGLEESKEEEGMGKPHHDDKGFVDSGCSRHMTSNIAYLSDFKQFDGGYVAFGGGAYGGKILGKGTLKTANLDFELPNENQILLKVPRKDNMYSFDMKNIIPKESLTCLVVKATLDESMLWHRRLSHINFKNTNKLVKDNLVRGLPIKRFENNQTCVAFLKGSNTELLDETSEILKRFIKEIENLMDKKVKIIRSDKVQRFKNKVWMFLAEKRQFRCKMKKVSMLDNSLNRVHKLETASPNEEDSTEEEPKVDWGNITNSLYFQTTPNTRRSIKIIPIDNVIGDVQSTVRQRMLQPTSEQGLNQQALLKLYLIHPGWKQCRKNFCDSNFNKFDIGDLLNGREALGKQNGSLETRKMKGEL
ncbi:ribonuclease H-like domain-containing protein [Tanacetum coccineum]